MAENLDMNMNINRILKLLPHRYPILLVDRVLELEPSKKIKALKNVSVNEPYFQGHFPEFPVMPGVLILESLAQASALLAFSQEQKKDTVYYFAGIDNARFKKPVTPGDQLILNAEVLRNKAGIWKFNAFATVDNEIVAQADLLCAVRQKGE
jgi:3-hydroxyacyl-[acyl-carrier-protein] dehydratase